MTDIALRVENLSKRYRIGAKEEGYKTLREAGGTMPFHQTQIKINSTLSKQILMGSLCNPRGGAVEKIRLILSEAPAIFLKRK